jgi:hypothetical protein
MNLLKKLILKENLKGKCLICFKVLENNNIFSEDNDKKIFFCCNNCKIEWQMKNS